MSFHHFKPKHTFSSSGETRRSLVSRLSPSEESSLSLSLSLSTCGMRKGTSMSEHSKSTDFIFYGFIMKFSINFNRKGQTSQATQGCVHFSSFDCQRKSLVLPFLLILPLVSSISHLLHFHIFFFLALPSVMPPKTKKEKNKVDSDADASSSSSSSDSESDDDGHWIPTLY